MANIFLVTTKLSIILLFFLSFTTSIQCFSRTFENYEDADILGLNLKKEKLTHFRLYWHDIVSGPNPTAIQIIKPPKQSPTYFGLVRMMDNPLTEGPKMSSKMVGRAQGFYALASQNDIGILMAMNFGFMEGKYNGSTITVLGKNMAMNKVREMPVIGGSGLFRFARGYVEARTYMFDKKSGNAIVQYDCFVIHY